MNEPRMYYFAYGSNADPDRFRSRVGDWRSRRAAWLDGHRLRFAASVQSEGGGGAVFDPDDGSRLAGVLYEISLEQQLAMDRVEADPSRNLNSAGGRLTITVDTDDGPFQAEVYNVQDDGAWHAPSEIYLGHILRGLQAAGHAGEVLDRVRAIAESGAARARSRDGRRPPPAADQD